MTTGGATFCQKCDFFSFKNVISCSQKIEAIIVSFQEMSIFPRECVPFGSLCDQNDYFQFRKKFISTFPKSQFLFGKYCHFQLGSRHDPMRADAVITGWGAVALEFSTAAIDAGDETRSLPAEVWLTHFLFLGIFLRVYFQKGACGALVLVMLEGVYYFGTL